MANKKVAMHTRINANMFGASADLPRIVEIDLLNLHRNPQQPRQFFDGKALQELADSIQEKGLLQPIVVRTDGEIEGRQQYMVVAGERRFRAHQLLGKPTIAAIVTEGDTEEIALIENMQREDLKPLELAQALSRLIETHQYTHEVAAKMLGKARNTLTQLLSLNRLDEQIKAECPTSDISKSVLIELAKMPPEEQLAAWERFKSGTSTVRDARLAKAKGVDAPTGPIGKRTKKFFNTKHGASVIIQAESPDDLTPDQIIAALTDALKAAKKIGTEV